MGIGGNGTVDEYIAQGRTGVDKRVRDGGFTALAQRIGAGMDCLGYVDIAMARIKYDAGAGAAPASSGPVLIGHGRRVDVPADREATVHLQIRQGVGRGMP